MIFYLIFLFGFSFHQVFCHFTFSNPEGQNDIQMRFANIDNMNKDKTLLVLTLYQHKGDEGIVLPPYNFQEITSNMNTHKKTIVLFNGHPSADSIEPFQDLREALFDAEDVNVISVFLDWTKHDINFVDALALSEFFGQIIGDHLKNLNILIDNFHFIGHCIGAEIGATVAKYLKAVGGQNIPRLTVFDPFISNDTKLNLAADFVDFVDAYHAGIYDPAFPPIGNVDFYPNSGKRQPGCESLSFLDKFICHHRRAIYLYIESMRTMVKAVEGHFSETQKLLRVKDNPNFVIFGYYVEPGENGAYYLPTFRSEPFLMDYF